MALREAINGNHLGIVNLLLKDPDVDPSFDGNLSIHLASIKGYLDIVNRLLEDPRVDPSAHGNVSLRNAIYKDLYDVVERLLQDLRVIKEGLSDSKKLAVAIGLTNMIELFNKYSCE